MLKLGASVPWQDAMEAMTGQRDVLATPLLNYFEPLRVWLEAKNAENGEFIGWDLPANVEKSSRLQTEKAAGSIEINKETARLLAPIFIEALQSLQNIRL